MRWISTKNKYFDKILVWIEDNILDRIYYKRILRRLQDAINSGFTILIGEKSAKGWKKKKISMIDNFANLDAASRLDHKTS